MQVNLGGLRNVVELVWRDSSRFVRLRLTAALLLVIAASIFTALGPIALKLVVDEFTGQAKGQTASPLFLIGIYVLSQWMARAVSEIRGMVYARAERRLFRNLSERLFGHLMHLPLQFHLERQTGAINQILENGVQGYQIILRDLVFTFLPVSVELATIIVVIARLAHPVFIWLFCGALLCYGAAFAAATAMNVEAAKSALAAHIEANGIITDGLLNYETVKYFTAEEVIERKVSRALARTENEWVVFFRRYALNGLCVATVFAIFLGATIVYAAHEVQRGWITIGDFVLVNSYMLQVARRLEVLGYAVQALTQGIAMLERLLLLFREKPEPEQRHSHISAFGSGQLEFEDVRLSYNPDRTVLRNLSFRIPAGKTLGIVGASGAGKSTIVRLLVRLLEPDGGRVLLDGTPISDLPLSKLREAISVVPQDTVLFNDTIGYNIAFGKQSCTHEEIEGAAKLAHLHEFIMSLPDQYNTRVGERGVKLSGGEKQRISIARAVIKRPRIYVFDEATSSLDSKTELVILRALREISRFSTTLLIAHRLSTVVHADEIMVLDGGTVAERGTHASLLRQNGKYSTLWMAQQRTSALDAYASITDAAKT